MKTIKDMVREIDMELGPRYAEELDKAGEILQENIAIGQVKAIGRMEVASAVKMLADDKSDLLIAIEEIAAALQDGQAAYAELQASKALAKHSRLSSEEMEELIHDAVHGDPIADEAESVGSVPGEFFPWITEEWLASVQAAKDGSE
jgi:hypothetical protein